MGGEVVGRVAVTGSGATLELAMAGSDSTGEKFAVGSASSRPAVSVAGGSVSVLELVLAGPQHCSPHWEREFNNRFSNCEIYLSVRYLNIIKLK